MRFGLAVGYFHCEQILLCGRKYFPIYPSALVLTMLKYVPGVSYSIRVIFLPVVMVSFLFSVCLSLGGC